MRTDELKGFSPPPPTIEGWKHFCPFFFIFSKGRRRRRRWILIFFFQRMGNALMAVSTVRYLEIDKSLSLPGKKPGTV